MHRGRQLLGQRREAQGDVVLGIARLQEGLHERARRRGRQARHRLAEHAGHLADRALAQPGLDETPRGLGHGDVLLAVHARVGPGVRKAEHPPQASEHLGREPGALLHLGRRSASAQDPLDGEQGQAILGHRGAQLLETEALLRQMLEQLSARLAVGAPPARRADLRPRSRLAIRRGGAARWQLGVAEAPSRVTSSTRQGRSRRIVRTVRSERCAMAGGAPAGRTWGATNTKPVPRRLPPTLYSGTCSFQASALASVWLMATRLPRQGSTRAVPPTRSTAVNRRSM